MSAHRCVLLIENDPVQIDILEEYFDFKNVVVQTVNSAKKGIAALRSNSFGLVITELNLPDMDGLEMIRWLRQDARFKAIPIVVLSTRALDEDRTASLAAGASVFLAKPTSLEQLFNAISPFCTHFLTS